MNTEHLRYFEHIYELRDYNTAAHRVHITATGLFRAMKSLERLLGVELFTKDDLGNLTPTDYAEAVYRFSQNLNANYALMRESLERIRAQKSNTIRFGSSQGMLGLMGPDFLFDLNRAHPDIQLNYRELNDYQIDEGVLNESFDLVFSVAPYNNDFITTELYADRVCFWVNTSSPLSALEKLSIQNLDGQNIALPGRGFKIFDILLKLSKETGISLGKTYEISELYRIYDFVAQSLGIGYTVATVNALDLFRNDSNATCIPTKELTLRFGISYSPYHPLTEPEQRFYGFCVNYAEKRFTHPWPQ